MQFELAPFDLDASYAEGVVSLEDMKAHLRVTHSNEDDLIGLLRDAAVDMVERYCGLYLAPREGVVWRGESLPSSVNLGVWPVTGITGIAFLDSEGSDATGTASDWRVVRRGEIALKPSKDLPSDVTAGVEITFNAGYTDEQRPAALVNAVKLFCGHLFRNREATVVGSISGEIPLGFRQLCNAYRMPTI